MHGKAVTYVYIYWWYINNTFSSLLPRLVSSDRCHLSNSPASINSDHKEFGFFYYFSFAHKATLKSYIYSNISYYSKPIYRGTINVATYPVAYIKHVFYAMVWYTIFNWCEASSLLRGSRGPVSISLDQTKVHCASLATHTHISGALSFTLLTLKS